MSVNTIECHGRALDAAVGGGFTCAEDSFGSFCGASSSLESLISINPVRRVSRLSMRSSFNRMDGLRTDGVHPTDEKELAQAMASSFVTAGNARIVILY